MRAAGEHERAPFCSWRQNPSVSNGIEQRCGYCSGKAGQKGERVEIDGEGTVGESAFEGDATQTVVEYLQARLRQRGPQQQNLETELAKLRAAAEEARDAQANGGKDSGGQRGKGHGRRDFDAERAPVETVVLEPPERSLPGGDQLVKIGEEVSEHFDYRPASIIRVRVVRPKYRKPTPSPGESPIAVAELPDRPIPRSVAGAGLIAHVIVQKYGDHMPLHRQQSIFKRSGVHLPRSTLGNLVQGGTALLGRIVDAMWQHAREHAAWLAIDATGVLVLAAEQCRRGHFWVVVAQRDHVLFRYTPKHDGSVPAKLLAGFAGYVIADASSVYHELYRNEPDIIEASCWSHYLGSIVIWSASSLRARVLRTRLLG